GGSTVYRPNALTGDPNHLAVMLCIPLLTLLPVYLRLERGHRLRVPLAVCLAFLFLVQLSTLSRSGLLGIVVGLGVLAVPYRRLLTSRLLLIPLAGVAALLAVLVWERRHYFEVLVRSRVQTSGRSESAHFQVYDFVPQILHSHPLFGLGLNNFSVYYQFVTGKTNWGPHSFYVALIVETGLVGSALFGLFLVWVFRRLRRERAEEARVRGHEQQQRAPWREQLAEAAQHALVVGDVLEDVEADDRVERPLDGIRVALDHRQAVDLEPQQRRELGLRLERDHVV